MSKVSRTEALEHISTWPISRVVALLQNNGVEEACWKAVEKRQIDGDELLHLTEGKLALWKSDLTRPLIWNLWTFVEELKRCPENYVEDKQKPVEPESPSTPVVAVETVVEEPTTQQQQQEQQVETESDTGWDTDFDDSDGNIDMDLSEIDSSDFKTSLKIFQANDRLKIENDAKGSSHSINKLGNSSSPPSLESTYANCETTTYANVGYAEDTPEETSLKNNSKLHAEQKSLAEKLKEQLLLRGTSLEPPLSAKPAIAPKPEGLLKRSKEEVILRRSEPRTSFLHKSAKAKVNGISNVPKKMSVPPPAEPTPSKQPSPTNDETLRNLPKPPISIHGFDLVANLPTTRPADDSDDEEDYEAFDEQIVEQHQRNSLMSRTDSGQSLSSPDRNSIGSAYHPASTVSHDEEEVYEIYESITEAPEEKGRDYKSQSNAKNPPPLPLKPPPNITTLHNQLNKADSKSERSQEKKSATLPHAISNLSINNVARPLPAPPEHRDTYYDRPWFHNLTREEANNLIKEHCTCHNGPDGYFLMRPSVSNPNNPLTLVLWCKDRVYNVPVRRRPDNRYSLGKAKPDEMTFDSIDDIVPFYKKEMLLLYTNDGSQFGSTRLTETPPKEKLNNYLN